MARGWGRSEEELEADKEQAREARQALGRRRSHAETNRLTQKRTIELSLARIREQLPKARGEERRRALETARGDLEKRLAELESPPVPDHRGGREAT